MIGPRVSDHDKLTFHIGLFKLKLGLPTPKRDVEPSGWSVCLYPPWNVNSTPSTRIPKIPLKNLINPHSILRLQMTTLPLWSLRVPVMPLLA
ncbi:hypothetical protein VNO77_19248 [Canavalia gladiata]|uniref:Uncharacterized protein n=1 Tax=Canavalia gladiata TaxID=3824 RepID=A0AAN9QKC0_CANGL